MKSRRKNNSEEADQDQWSLNLPDDVLMNIICRLPIKTLISSKCLSKLWLNLISSDNHFANLHHQRAPAELLIRTSTKLYLGNIQFPNDPFSDPNHNISVRSNICNNSFGSLESDHKPLFSNSCNGFVCFHQRQRDSKLLDAVICNPVSGEFITVPNPQFDRKQTFHAYVLGFSGKQNRYKLLRLGFRPPSKSYVQICTFEKGSLWRNLGDCPFNFTARCDPPLAFLEGKIHFNYYRLRRDGYVDCFDFDDEQFGKVALPPPSSDRYGGDSCVVIRKMEIRGGLGSCLSVSYYDDGNHFHVWVMKKYGVADSWAELWSFKRCVSNHCFPQRCLLMEMGNGELLLCSGQKRLVLYNPILNSARSVGWDRTFEEVIVYSPALVLLKDALAGYEARVQNLNSR